MITALQFHYNIATLIGQSLTVIKVLDYFDYLFSTIIYAVSYYNTNLHNSLLPY